jgi:hypothetical protein
MVIIQHKGTALIGIEGNNVPPYEGDLKSIRRAVELSSPKITRAKKGTAGIQRIGPASF